MMPSSRGTRRRTMDAGLVGVALLLNTAIIVLGVGSLLGWWRWIDVLMWDHWIALVLCPQLLELLLLAASLGVGLSPPRAERLLDAGPKSEAQDCFAESAGPRRPRRTSRDNWAVCAATLVQGVFVLSLAAVYWGPTDLYLTLMSYGGRWIAFGVRGLVEALLLVALVLKLRRQQPRQR